MLENNKYIVSLLDFIFEKKLPKVVRKKNLVEDSERARFEKAKTIQSDYVSSRFSGKDLVIEFKSKDLKNGSGTEWKQSIKFHAIPEDLKNKKNLTDLLNSNIKVHCTCPDYLFQGYQFIATKNNYNIKRENRPPLVKNPDEEGTVCKHLISVLNKLDNYNKNILKDLKK